MTSSVLSPQDKDAVFAYQCGLKGPMALGKGGEVGWLRCGDIVGRFTGLSLTLGGVGGCEVQMVRGKGRGWR